MVYEFNRYDRQKRGYITFSDFRKVLEVLNTNIGNDQVEFVIYLLKDFDDLSASIFDLKYLNLLDILSPKEEPKRVANELESSQIVVSKEEFIRRSEGILKQLALYLFDFKISLKKLFPNILVIFDNSDTYKALYLKEFVNILTENAGITIDSTDAYCIFDRLKNPANIHSIEIVDFEKLTNEMNLFGIFEETEQTSSIVEEKSKINIEQEVIVSKTSQADLLEEEPESPIETNIPKKISEYLKEGNISYDYFVNKISDKISVKNIDQFIQLSHFVQFLKQYEVINSTNVNRVEFLPYMSGELLNLTEFRKIFCPPTQGETSKEVPKVKEEPQQVSINLIHCLTNYLKRTSISFERLIFPVHLNVTLGINNDRYIDVPFFVEFIQNKGIINSNNINYSIISDITNDSGMMNLNLLKKKVEPSMFEVPKDDYRKISKVIIDEIFTFQLKST